MPSSSIAGLILPSDLVTYMDSFATLVKLAYPTVGFGVPSETGTLAAASTNAINAIEGNSTTGQTGITPADIKTNALNNLIALQASMRMDGMFRNVGINLIASLDSHISANLPPGRTFINQFNSRALNAYLLRANGLASPVVSVTQSMTLTAATLANGALQSCTVANAPGVVVTFIGANDWNESLPSAVLPATAISGTQNGYILQISGNVPTGVTKVAIYRSLYGSYSGPYNWGQDVAVTAGSPFPAINLFNAEVNLRQSFRPPSWLSCMATAEEAFLYALASGSAASNNIGGLLQLLTSSLMTEKNVLLGPSNGFIGLLSPASAATFGSLGFSALASPGPNITSITSASTGGSLASGSTYAYRISAVAGGSTVPGTEATLLVPAALASPTGLTVTPSTTGGTVPLGSVAYRISALNAVGQTIPGTEVTALTTGVGTNSVSMTWNAVTGATGYNVYGRASGTEQKIATNVQTTSFTDTGSVTPSGAMPASNTTATSTNALTINWSAVTGATGYNIYGRTASGEQLIASNQSGTSYVDTGSITPSGAMPASNTSGTFLFTAGSIQTVNQTNLQGFAGATALRARVTTALNGSLTLSITYQYVQASTGPSALQTATVSAPAFATGFAGDIAVFPIPAGQLVTGITASTSSGSASSGAVVLEAGYTRTY